jgi:hypothetical protein
MGEVKVEVKASVNPTEDPLKVKRAVENVLGNIESEVKTLGRESLLVGRATGRESLSKLYNLLRRERIRDAARGALFGGLNDKSIIFYLNKQVAYAGHVSFSEPAAESPLGSIEVQIQCDKPRELIEWLAPKTT